MPTVVIAPSNVAAFPEGGGHFWVYLQYVLGLRQLGCEVYWLEAFRTKGRADRETGALATFRARMEQRGLGAKAILYVTHGKEPPPEAPEEYLDMRRSEAEAVVERADLLVNFHYAISPGLLARFRRTAVVDIDPGHRSPVLPAHGGSGPRLVFLPGVRCLCGDDFLSSYNSEAEHPICEDDLRLYIVLALCQRLQRAEPRTKAHAGPLFAALDAAL